MKEYNLTALLKIRERKKETAETSLKTAISVENAEQQKLVQIENRLRDTLMARSQRQDNFFKKAQVSTSSKSEVVVQILSQQKNMVDEIDLRKMIETQQQQLRLAARNVEVARLSAVDATRNLKVIEKHQAAWKRNLQRAEEIKEEYATDDQNGVRYLLRKA